MGVLPVAFEALEPYAARWSRAGEAARAAVRADASPEEGQAFYEAGAGCMDQAVAYLNGKDLARLDPPDRQLLELMLSFAQVSHGVETLKDDEAVNRRARARLKLVDHSPF